MDCAKQFHGKKVVDVMGMEHEMEVMMAIHQGYKTERDPLDPLSGTIKDNPLYQEWLKDRETKKADPVTVDAMQSLSKEVRTSILVEELRKKVNKSVGKGSMESSGNAGKKKNKRKKKGMGNDITFPPETTTEQSRKDVAVEQKAPVFKIIPRQAQVDSRSTVKEYAPQEKIISRDDRIDITTKESILNPSSTPYLSIPSIQVESKKDSKSEGKKFMTLSKNKSTPLSHSSPSLASITEGMSKKMLVNDGEGRDVSQDASNPVQSSHSNKTGDKHKKKFQTSSTCNTKGQVNKDKQLNVRYFDPETSTPASSNGTKKEKDADKDNGPQWFIDIPMVKRGEGMINIASFNLPSLRRSPSTRAAGGKVKDEHQEDVMRVSMKSESMHGNQDKVSAESSKIVDVTVAGKK